MTDRTQELAFFSNDVYSLEPSKRAVKYGGNDFDVIARMGPTPNGFFAAAYKSQRNDHVIIAFRGTDDLSDGLVDAGMVATRLNAQALESEVFAANVIRSVQSNHRTGAPADITVTGHSLGGGLAQLNAERFDLHGETFNAYGTFGLVSHHKEGGTQMINHVRAGDPVSAASGHFGEVRIYATSDDVRTLEAAGYGYDHGYHPERMLAATSVSAHSMTNFLDKDGHRSIINDQSEALYQSHREAIDAYRNDVRTSRELTTAAIGHPTEASLAVGSLAAPVAVGLVAGQVYQKEQELVRAAHAVEGAADWTARVAAEALAPSGTTAALYGSATGSPELDKRLKALSIDHDGHPGYAMYTQALDGVTKLDDKHGRAPDNLSRHLAASLAVEGRREGMTRIDHVVLSDDASRAYAVQGALNSPHKTVASVQTELGIATSIEASSREWSRADHTATHAQQATQAQTQAQAQSHAPSLSR